MHIKGFLSEIIYALNVPWYLCHSLAECVPKPCFQLMQLAEMEAKLPPQSAIATPKPFGIQDENELEPSAPEEDLPEPPPYEEFDQNENSDTEVDAF